jgi:hypothetical protein
MGTGAILRRLPHDVEKTRGNSLGSSQEICRLDLPMPAPAGEHLLVGLQHRGLGSEAAIALAPELGLKESQQIPVEAGAQGIWQRCEGLRALHGWEAVVEHVDHKMVLDSDIGNSFHAAPLAQTT